jgi:hypothetical protein
MLEESSGDLSDERKSGIKDIDTGPVSEIRESPATALASTSAVLAAFLIAKRNIALKLFFAFKAIVFSHLQQLTKSNQGLERNPPIT